MDQKRKENREKILIATVEEFHEKGLKFTMDDIARRLGMSKKTIYVVFRDKEDLFMNMVDYFFGQVKIEEENILKDDSLTTIEKLTAVLGVMPEKYQNIDFGKLYSLKEKYPSIYMCVQEHLETGWESTIELIEQGMKEGVIRPVRIPVFKTMMEATLEQFFQRDILVQKNISYQDALKEVVDILIQGIVKQAA